MKRQLSKEQFYVLNNIYNISKGRTPVFSDLYLNKILEDSSVVSDLVSKGYIEDRYDMITQKGIEALEPYKVSGAVIMAAGPSTRCIPISLEKPKGLFEIKGEKLIERKIEQLQEAGIKDITIVLGYKKEMFYYLKNKYNVKFIENNEFLIKNNIHSLYLAKEYLKNAYICVSDDYFEENPFNKYEYSTFYAGIHIDKKTQEMYVYTDEDDKIVKMQKNQNKGHILLGHSFWQEDFADYFVQFVENNNNVVNDTNVFWEWIIQNNIDVFPSIYYKKFASRAIVEFDYFDDLRRFDSEYVKNTNSKIIHNIISVLKCEESEIRDFRNVSEGMTNTSFIFKYDGVDYIYRHPGDGTEKIISRENERNSLELAKKWNIDSTYVFMDVDEGWKISRFVSDFREPDYNNFEDSKKILNILRTLHSLPIKVDYEFKPWEDACEIEKILIKENPNCFKEYALLKEKIHNLFELTKCDGVNKCFCHADTYKPNWMIEPDGHVILIDWEYSGYSDPGVDVGYYIVDAMYDFDEAEKFILEYLQGDATHLFHFMAYTAIIAYYWFVWALYRESCGANMSDALLNWKEMAIKYANHLV